MTYGKMWTAMIERAVAAPATSVPAETRQAEIIDLAIQGLTVPQMRAIYVAHYSGAPLPRSRNRADVAEALRAQALGYVKAQAADRQRQERADELIAEADKAGPPYVVPCWGHGRELVPVDYHLALAIARSRHPSRVLANTEVYRYGKFAEVYDGPGKTVVTVTMFGEHIATFRPEGVYLWSRGYHTTSTSEALSNLVTGGYFYHDKGELFFSAYASTGDRRTGTPHTDGTLYHYHRNPVCPADGGRHTDTPPTPESCEACGCQTGEKS